MPIFALCSGEFKLNEIAEAFDKKQTDYQSNKSSKTVTEVQLQDCLQLQKMVM